ncbi:O-antigen polymerase [uncultured Psychromonas sp.]|uniref:O-antigen polymerase n=1 Tax=uncultured Psychromonas sp. TaxID=173974 RepID=UPI0026302350|nr:O-antigen polymerase [uncultured Psychromonas sp.]
MSVSTNVSFTYGLPLLVAVFIIAPTFPDKFGFLLESFLYLIVISFFFLYLYLFKIKLNDQYIGLYFGYIFFALLLSLFQDLVHSIYSLSDYIEIFKVLSYFIIFLCFYNVSYYYGIEFLGLLMKVFTLLFFAVAILNIFYITLLSDTPFSEIINLFYKRSESIVLSDKAIVPFTQIYHYGTFMLFGCLYSLIKLLNKKNFFDLIVFLIFFFALILSQSRSIMVSLVFGIVLCLLFYSSKKMINRVVYSLVYLLAFLFIFKIFYYKYSENLLYLFNGLNQMSSGESSSLNSRLSQFMLAIQGGFFWGSGVAKNFYKLESLPAVYILRYGFFGLMFFYIIVYYVASVARHLARYNNRFEILFKSINIWLLIYPITSLSSPHQDTPKLAIFFYGILGITLGVKLLVNNKSSSDFI